MSAPAPGPAPPLLDVMDVARDYRLARRSILERTRKLRVLHGVSLRLTAGASLGLIGESGAGKSTLARLVLALEKPDLGTVRFDGHDLAALTRRRRLEVRRRMQMVFQDPYGSLDPRLSVARSIAEPLVGLAAHLGPEERRRSVAAGLAAVGLSPDDGARYPHQFSGGERQRIAIARALITDPDLLVADEPVSALDVSVRGQILNLLMDLRARRPISYLLISHDLTVIRHVTDRVAVIYLGRIVEEGPTRQVLARPAHPYTAALVTAVPKPDPAFRRRPAGIAPEPASPQFVRHCPYAARCANAREHCRSQMPPLAAIAPGRSVACFYPVG
jgi:peptide/nickel transport system ATP-binding protein